MDETRTPADVIAERYPLDASLDEQRIRQIQAETTPDFDPEYEQRLRRAEGKEEPADYRGTLVTRRSAPKLTVTTEYGTFTRRTWHEYTHIVLEHTPKGTFCVSWHGDFRNAVKAADSHWKKMGEYYGNGKSWNPTYTRAACNLTIHAVSDGDEVKSY